MAAKLSTLLAELLETDVSAIEAAMQDPNVSWKPFVRGLVASTLESEYSIVLEPGEIDKLHSPAAALNILIAHGIEEP